MEYLQQFPAFESKGVVSRDSFPFEHLLKRVRESIDSTHVKLRTLAVDVLMQIYQLKGFKEIEELVGSLQTNQISMITDHIPEALEYLEARGAPAEPEPFSLGGGGGGGAPGTAKSNKGKKVACKFCGVKANFKGDALDVHYVDECVVLTQCPGCP